MMTGKKDRSAAAIDTAANSRRTSASKAFKKHLTDRWSKHSKVTGWDLKKSVLYTNRKTLVTHDYVMQQAAPLIGVQYTAQNPGKHSRATAKRYYLDTGLTDRLHVQHTAMYLDFQAAIKKNENQEVIELLRA